jgi:serine/threonine protein phosphatase PrpC
MTETKLYLEAFLNQQKIIISEKQKPFFEKLLANEDVVNAVKIIKENQKFLMDKYKINNRVYEITSKQITFPNAKQGEPYSEKFDFVKNGVEDIVHIEFEGLEIFGLLFNLETKSIEGIPTIDGDVKATMKFRIEGEAEYSILNEKIISFYINKDPKKLWSEIESDKTDPYWKEDNVSTFSKFGIDKNIVVASKRGRSHSNVGSFRDDDFSFYYNESTGWGAVAVADGAGSYKYSRQGSKIACDAVVEYVKKDFTNELATELETLLIKYNEIETNPKTIEVANDVNKVIEVEKPNDITSEPNTDDIQISNDGIKEVVEESLESVTNKIKGFLYKNIGSAAFNIHKKIEAFANENNHTIKDYGSTLIFVLYKKMDFGYCILSFGVGDCPIAVINKDESKSQLLNWLDVGEFGGGTRFITMPEIFQDSTILMSRINFKIIEDFSYLILMTDGIYDPKFAVEANLDKTEKWKEFIEDLKGVNADNLGVVFDPNNNEIASQLSAWMDFWSAGNHDDRTLAIVY